MLLYGFLFTFEFTVLTASGMVFIGIPIANVFWASALPSIWLWVYILSALLARALLASRPALRGAVYFLDFSDHPVRSLGIIAGTVAAGLSGIFIIFLSLI
jgi:hypothetical protein